MWHPLQADFPQQSPLNDFERGPLSVQAGELIGLVCCGSGCVRPALNPRSDWPGWLEPDVFDPQRHQRLVVIGRWQGLPLLLQLAHRGQARKEGWPDLRSWLLQSDAAGFDLLATAAGLANWEEQHRFCGRCGTRTQPRQDEYARECPRCHLRQYPRVSPCIITLVWKEDALLLARSPRFAPGVYSTLAGFIETGESAEQALHREVMEEVGVAVGNFRYLGSQSWPFPHSLMLGYWAEYQGGDIHFDGVEIEDARWYALDDLPPLPPPTSISRYLIDSFLQWRGFNV
ncbi:NAD(+) diphosphatase [Marinospirillum alkaliphilum]|uniref:NAD(+) diphosphatase n=1 Tax=Marinospirillum alkaliphilum DSM 21637 TaxID=1122209 RepID=A0A1K1WZG6_9GAMM|nr:NAD(+) diphosphatase [Marinospirillum alkaliphilum]SFX42451.1 NAD+ diphosphatase [Marinospirillum alkaliphilum DSM 21637]